MRLLPLDPFAYGYCDADGRIQGALKFSFVYYAFSIKVLCMHRKWYVNHRRTKARGEYRHRGILLQV